MDYHADRFPDASLMFYDNDRLIALLPGHMDQNSYYSHGGLTYGGMICSSKMDTANMLNLFEALTAYFKEKRIKTFIYKAIPGIYHSLPAEEDLYALFRCGARLIKREASAAIKYPLQTSYRKGRKWAVNKGKKQDIQIRDSHDFDTFMHMEARILQEKYDKSPTHTAAEIKLLADRFPDHIKLSAAFDGTEMLGGVILYLTRQVAHAQYISYTERGQKMFAMDVLLDELIRKYTGDKTWFDFGISTEKGGYYLNEGLMANKESFGASAVMYDTYQLDLD